MKLINSALVLLMVAGVGNAIQSSRYINPILPGFHPDPSCIYVEELDHSFFCATSSFSVFPGIPIYASKNLTHWKLASNVLNRRSQLPAFASTPTGQDGIFAPTLRYHNGTFYLITTWVSISSYQNFTMDNIIFTTTDPYNSSAWSNPTHFDFLGYDPSLFWDTDGTAYLTGAHATSTGTAIALAPFDPDTGTYLGETTYPYNGTGIGTPEGPHLYRHDQHYYIPVAEGGTEALHRGSTARSRSLAGPYENYPGNPVVHAAGGNGSFVRSVGHADIFEDGAGGWWGVALAQRRRAAARGAAVVPMGRETVLFPVSWGGDGWVRVDGDVRGVMEGVLPGRDGGHVVRGEGPWVGEADAVDFEGGGALPAHWVYVRVPVEGAYVVEEGRLALVPSARNLSAMGGGGVVEGTTFVGRRQEHTLFVYSVDVEFEPKRDGEEAGVTVYLDEKRHVDFGIVSEEGRPHLRLKAFSSNEGVTVPGDVTVAFLGQGGKARLEIRAANATHYTFSAGKVEEDTGDCTNFMAVGYAAASLVSGGYTGTLVGTYATTNGVEGNRTISAYISRWRYQGLGQEISEGVFV